MYPLRFEDNYGGFLVCQLKFKTATQQNKTFWLTLLLKHSKLQEDDSSKLNWRISCIVPKLPRKCILNLTDIMQYLQKWKDYQNCFMSEESKLILIRPLFTDSYNALKTVEIKPLWFITEMRTPS